MRLRPFGAVILFPVASFALSWTATPFSPPSYPLAVRSPYLSAWLPQGAGTALNGAWPEFWTGSVSFHNFRLVVLRSLPTILDPWMGRLRECRRRVLQLPWFSGRIWRQLPTGHAEERRGACPAGNSFQALFTLPQFTSTQSIFVLTAGGIDLTVSFLSPVEVLWSLIRRTLYAHHRWVSAKRSA